MCLCVCVCIIEAKQDHCVKQEKIKFNNACETKIKEALLVDNFYVLL